MAQTPDIIWDSPISGRNLRTEGNGIFAALASKFSGGSEPNSTIEYQNWIDTSQTPPIWRIRNAGNNAWVDFAEVTDAGITPIVQGGAIPSLTQTQTFQASQRIKTTAGVGQIAVGSTLQSGVVARIPLIGHNSNNAETVGANLVLRQNVNTAGQEDFTVEIEVRRGGGISRIVSIGSVNLFTEGSNRIADFDELRQGGQPVQDIINASKARVENGGSFSGNVQLTQENAGQFIRYNGQGNRTISVPRLAQGSWVMVINDSPNQGRLTFAPVGGQTEIRTPRRILRGISGQSPTCVLFWFLSVGQLVNIFGDNTVS